MAKAEPHAPVAATTEPTHQASANTNCQLAVWAHARNNAEGCAHMCRTKRQGRADIALSADFINKADRPTETDTAGPSTPKAGTNSRSTALTAPDTVSRHSPADRPGGTSLGSSQPPLPRPMRPPAAQRYKPALVAVPGSILITTHPGSAWCQTTARAQGTQRHHNLQPGICTSNCSVSNPYPEEAYHRPAHDAGDQ